MHRCAEHLSQEKAAAHQPLPVDQVRGAEQVITIGASAVQQDHEAGRPVAGDGVERTGPSASARLAFWGVEYHPDDIAWRPPAASPALFAELSLQVGPQWSAFRSCSF
jgi:hypothetical protein